MKAYFTVEAACILPLIISVYIFLIYGMFYQYDRCVASLQAIQMVLEENSSCNPDASDYLAWTWQEKKIISTAGETVSIVKGTVGIPFKGIINLSKSEKWLVEVSFSAKKMDPVSWIRILNKILEEK